MSGQDVENAMAPAVATAAVDGSSYWSIVWQQLRKNSVAMIALWTLVGLWALAICAPFVASNVPLLWWDGDAVRLVVLERLFDRSLYPSAVDQFFNLLAISLPVWLLAPIVAAPKRSIGYVLAAIGLAAWIALVGYSAFHSRISIVVALSCAIVGGVLLALAARFGRRRRNQARALCFILAAITLFVVHGRVRDEWPVRDWVQDVWSQAAFPVIPYHPDNAGDSEALSRDDSAGSQRGTLLGYDPNGRDVAARLLFGTRISLTIGIVAVSIYVLIGVILGSLAGYYGGKVDLTISRLIEIMICFPTLFLLLTIIAVFESRSIFLIMFAIGAVGWPGVARLVRGEFIRQRSLDYVTAARALGLGQRRVIFRHILPNCVGPVLVSATFGIAAAIVVESGIAFLGLGDPSAASWGQMLTTGRSSQEWHLILAPGFAIFFVMTVFNLLGEGLRDALDPKLRR